MRWIARTALAAVAVLAASTSTLVGGSPATAGAQPSAAASTVLPFGQTLRRCDFSEFEYVGGNGYGRASGLLRADGGDIAADIQFATGKPNTRYDVRLIQVPRSSARTCNPGEPGVAAAVLMTDGAGAGAVTVRGPVMSDATGAWVSITRPGTYSQTPAEFYTTDFIVAV
jgi:hypothetical protein